MSFQHIIVQKKKGNNRELGASLVEYALLVALIAAVSITSLTAIGREIADTFCTSAGKINNLPYGAGYSWQDGCCLPKASGGGFGGGGCLE